MTSIRRAIADAVNETDDSYWYRVKPGDIESVEFRKGCSEIDVTFSLPEDRQYGGSDFGSATIDAAPVLSQLLTWAMHTEVTHDDDE